MNSKKDVKLTIVGDGAVGKTCMLVTYTKREFPTDYIPTVYESHEHEVTVDNVKYNLKLMDTAGQEEHQRLRSLCYPGTQCFILCFSLESKDSYKNISNVWVPDLKLHMPNVPILLVGTKSDVRDANLASDHGEKLKKKIHADHYLECSAKNMRGLDSIFQEAVRIATKSKANVEEKKTKKNCMCSVM